MKRNRPRKCSMCPAWVESGARYSNLCGPCVRLIEDAVFKLDSSLIRQRALPFNPFRTVRSRIVAARKRIGTGYDGCSIDAPVVAVKRSYRRKAAQTVIQLDTQLDLFKSAGGADDGGIDLGDMARRAVPDIQAEARHDAGTAGLPASGAANVSPAEVVVVEVRA